MADVSVLKVYESAAVIGREIESVIDEYGSDAVVNLMPHVIKVLEQLENLVNQKEQDRAKIESLEEDLLLLRNEGVRKNDDVVKLQSEISQLEELIKSEEVDLLNTADKIQRENRQLKEQLSEKDKMVASEIVQEQETIKVLSQMKETVDKQRDELRRKDADVRSKTEEIEALQQQVERYLKINSDLHRKNKLQQEYAKNLIHEKSQLHSQIAAMEQDQQQASGDQVEEEQVEGDGEERLHGESQKESVVASEEERDTGTDVDKSNSNMQWVNLEGKMIIDKKDKNRPRFTLKEMSYVLEERDNAKMRITELEDELDNIRPKAPPIARSPALRRTQAVRRERTDSTSGIKRFFGDILKKFSPQKKPTENATFHTPGYIEGAWCVLEPDDDEETHRHGNGSNTHSNGSKTHGNGSDHHGNRSNDHGNSTNRDLVYTPSSNGVTEEVHLQPYPDSDQVPLISDNDLNKNVDPRHFGSKNDSNEQDTSEGKRSEDHGDGLSDQVDLNGNDDVFGDEGRPPEGDGDVND